MYVRVLTVLGPCICVPEMHSWLFRRVYARTRVCNSIMTVIQFQTRDFATKRLSERTETTNACRKIYPYLRKAFVEIYREPR